MWYDCNCNCELCTGVCFGAAQHEKQTRMGGLLASQLPPQMLLAATRERCGLTASIQRVHQGMLASLCGGTAAEQWVWPGDATEWVRCGCAVFPMGGRRVRCRRYAMRQVQRPRGSRWCIT